MVNRVTCLKFQWFSGEDTIEIVFLTEDVFQGRVFVVGHAEEDGCFSREVGYVAFSNKSS